MTEPRRIDLLDVPYIPPEGEGRGGSHVLIIVQNLSVPLDRRVWLECQAIEAAGFDVSVICPRAAGDASYEEIAGVRIHRYGPPRRARGPLGYVWEVVYCWLVTAWLTVRVARRRRIDAIQACNPPDTYFALAAPLKRLSGTRFVYDQHDLCPELAEVRFTGLVGRIVRRAMLLLERATYRTADHVITTNGSFRSVALTRGRLQPGAVSVVRSGPVAEQMRPGVPDPSLRNGRRHLASYLGVMGQQDGVDVMLRAVAHLVHEVGRTDCQFVLMGFGDRYEDLRALATALEIDPWVTFTGRADDAMISRVLSTTDVGLAPDPPNGFNDLCTMNKVVEYMAFGVPIVSFDLTETRVSAGDAAIYVPGPSVEAFAQAIDRLLDDDESRSRMGMVARERIEQGLSWEHQRSTYVEVYRRLLGMAGGDGDQPSGVPAQHVVEIPAHSDVA